MATEDDDAGTVHEDVAGHRLIERIKELIAEGNARAVRIQTDDSKVFLEIPLTPAAFAGGVVMLAAPWLAVLATVAALVARVSVQIIREPVDAQAPPSAERPAPPPPVRG